MRCANSEEFTGDGSKAHLDKLQDLALLDIHEVLGVEPHFGIPDHDLTEVRYRLGDRNVSQTYFTNILAPNIPPFMIFFQGDRRIWELSHLTWLHPNNLDKIRNPNTRGVYLYNSGTILLHKTRWCRQALIHELLHSTSVFSRSFFKINSQQKEWRWDTQRPLREGITETLTGYVINRKYPDCYGNWRYNVFDECSVSELMNVKTWCSLAQCVGINDLAEFYLSEADNIAEPWYTFVDSVQNNGFDDFTPKLDEDTTFNVTSFHQMCVDAIPNYRDTYESPDQSLNINNIS